MRVNSMRKGSKCSSNPKYADYHLSMDIMINCEEEGLQQKNTTKGVSLIS